MSSFRFRETPDGLEAEGPIFDMPEVRAPADPWRAVASLLYALATAAWLCLPAVVVWAYRGVWR